MFEENTSTDYGGALDLECNINFRPECTFRIDNSTFRKNKAEVGGAIFYNLFMPNKTNLVFENNQATKGYGKDFASYAFKLRVAEKPQ